MSSSTDTALERLIAAVEARDAAAYAALFAEDAVALHPLSPDPIRGRAAIEAAERELFDSFSQVSVEVLTVARKSELCAAEVVLRATNTGPIDVGAGEPLPATGRAIELAATWWLEVRDDGLIVSERDYFDTAALMAQLGLSDG